jgi:hypothetical protein
MSDTHSYLRGLNIQKAEAMTSYKIQQTRALIYVLMASVGIFLLPGPLSFAANSDTASVGPTQKALLPACDPDLVNDSEFKVTDLGSVTEIRQQLINKVWGTQQLPILDPSRIIIYPAVDLNPTAFDAEIAAEIQSFVDIPNLQRINMIEYPMWDAKGGFVHRGLALHFVPATRVNNRVVLVSHGHACNLADADPLADIGYGLTRTIKNLIYDGYSVVGLYLPNYRPDACLGHDNFFSLPVNKGSPMQFFLEPTLAVMTYLKTYYPQYTEVDIIGLSGGGWLTTVYAALDTRIKISFPVAGTIPLYLRCDMGPQLGSSVGDTEQNWAPFYTIAGYKDLYVLGSQGATSDGSPRRQVQILNRRDTCCFGENQHDATKLGPWDAAIRTYEASVREKLASFAQGSFRLEIDENSTAHMISHGAIFNTILAELNDDRRSIGAATNSDAFVRGANGTLWQWNAPSGWTDTSLPLAGNPAVLQGIVNAFDIFYRGNDSRLMHAYPTSGGWQADAMGGVISSDPAAASWGSGRYDVIALGGDYRLYHWVGLGNTVHGYETVSGGLGLGPVSISTWGRNRLDVFFKGWDRAVYHNSTDTGSGPWSTVESLGGVIDDFPSAISLSNKEMRVYALGMDGALYEQFRPFGGRWGGWASVSAAARAAGTQLAGTPSAILLNGRPKVWMRSLGGNLTSFSLPSSAWSFSNGGGIIIGTPTAVNGGAFVQGLDEGLWFFNGMNWMERGGYFD